MSTKHVQVHEEEITLTGVKNALDLISEACKGKVAKADMMVGMSLMLHSTGKPEIFMFMGRQLHENVEAAKRMKANQPDEPKCPPAGMEH